MRKLFSGVLMLSISLACIAGTAKADVVKPVTMSFQSGATFTGSVSFADDFSNITGVSGLLMGYQPNITGYQGAGSDPIDMVFALNTNFSSGPPIYGNYLLDGSGFNFIQFTYDYSNAPSLVFADPSAGIFGLGNYINSNPLDPLDPTQDAFVSGQIGAVPELSTWIMLIIGFVGLGLYSRNREVSALAESSAS